MPSRFLTLESALSLCRDSVQVAEISFNGSVAAAGTIGMELLLLASGQERRHRMKAKRVARRRAGCNLVSLGAMRQ